MAELAWAVRAVHVLAAALLVGGGILAAAAPSRAISRRYEWIAAAALGTLVITGVGNLGALGAGLAAPTTLWGRVFLLKLALVGAIALVAVARALSVAWDGDRAAAHAAIITSVLGAGAMVIGVWLGHG